MEAFTVLQSKYVVIPVNDIDTDQIIPARFLKVTDKEGLGDNLFCDWRYNPDGSVKQDFILNQPQAKGLKILVAGDNFGCGSSREHAPWALVSYGFRAVLSTSFADIFKNNALKNGLLPVEINADIQQKLFELANGGIGPELRINLKEQMLTGPDGMSQQFPIDTFSKKCLLEGIDQLGYLLKQQSAIEEYERTHPQRVDTWH